MEMFSGTFACSSQHGCTSVGAFQERPRDRGPRGRKGTRSRAPLPPALNESKDILKEKTQKQNKCKVKVDCSLCGGSSITTS